MFSKDNFPNVLIQQYLSTSNKLKKFERVVFKRFAPNVEEVSSEFQRLGVTFHEAGIFQYAAMCFLGAAKCENSLGNKMAEIDFLLKAAREFAQANQEVEKLNLQSNQKEYIEGALKSYFQALSKLEDDSVLKAAVIREIRTINPNFEATSNFVSPCHRCYDLYKAANISIENKDYVSALEKLTDIFDNITERKKEDLYKDIMIQSEISRVLLLVVLNLPPSRQSPSHIKLLEKYSSVENIPDCTNSDKSAFRFKIPSSVETLLKDLVITWQERDTVEMNKTVLRLFECRSLKPEHYSILKELSYILDGTNTISKVR